MIMNILKITSKTNNRIKHLKKLIADKSYRYKNREYVIEGLRVLDNAESLKKLFVMEGSEIPKIRSGKTYIVSKNVFKNISSTENSQGVIAVAELKILDSSHILDNANYVLLDKLQDPGNMGTIIRTACSFGIKGVIITQGCVDPFSPKVVRAASSAIEKLDIIQIDDVAKLGKFNVVAADVGGENIRDFKWPKNYILAIGNEANGISEDVRKISKNIISIPISQSIESLNAAVSAGIILYLANN